jgi:dTDP-4-dehydrorhamnose reductase
MKILIIGSNGQIGWELVREATAAGCDFVALDRRQLEITDTVSLQKVFAQHKPEIVINAAAYTAVDRAEQEPEIAFSVNRDAVGSLAEICASQSIALIQISTDYVFDGSKGQEYTEDDPVNALGVYGMSKWQGENAVRESLERHIILRTSWVFGLHGDNFLKTIINKARDHKELSIVSDQYGGPTPADLIARVILDICKKISAGTAVWGTYNFSGMPHNTWSSFAREIINVGLDLGFLTSDVVINPIATSQYKTLASRPLDSRLSNLKIQKIFEIQEFSYKPSIKYVISQLMK